ncbi:putative carboxylesterase 18 [Acorus calamus]|uniref:Carboxylesterase 18 n=1 Tax=Acorus calamus TaxID=4465 RepID=A0AAV9CJB3_ACOCL|nr:putative carboxylesterase 18 [Acorus calamus]
MAETKTQAKSPPLPWKVWIFATISSAVTDALCASNHTVNRRLSRFLDPRASPSPTTPVSGVLSTDHPHPAAYDDAAAVLRFLDSSSPILPPNADLTNVFLSGDSAGANIVHHAAKWFSSNAHLLKTLKIKGTVSIQPFFGGVDRTASEVRLEGAPIVNIKRVEWMWEAFLPVGSDRDHPASNVFGPRSESDGFDWGTFPPTVVIIGGFDPLQDRQREYYEGLKKRGVDVRVVEYPNAIHAFYVFPELPESGVFIDMVGRFIEEKSGGVK